MTAEAVALPAVDDSPGFLDESLRILRGAEKAQRHRLMPDKSLGLHKGLLASGISTLIECVLEAIRGRQNGNGLTVATDLHGFTLGACEDFTEALAGGAGGDGLHRALGHAFEQFVQYFSRKRREMGRPQSVARLALQ